MAVKGTYDSYTETFTYRSEDEIGHLRATSLSAPCHATTRPLVAYAYFGRLISSSKELQDVQSAYEDTIPEEMEMAHAPEDLDFSFHSSPL